MEDKIKEIIRQAKNTLKANDSFVSAHVVSEMYITFNNIEAELSKPTEYKHKYTCDSCGEVTRSDKPIIKCLACSDEPTDADKMLDYAYTDIDDYEETTGETVSLSFKIGWEMARVTIKTLRGMGGREE
jgi:hypothetical protein